MSLNWATGSNSDKAENPELMGSPDRITMWLDIKKVLDWVNLRFIFTLKYIPKAKAHFESGGWMDPPEIRGIAKNGRLLVEGKNRLNAAKELGETHAPCSVPLNLVDQLQSIV